MIPDFQTVMLPLLQLLSDNQELSTRDIIEALAETFDLSDDERKALLPSGRMYVFNSRVGWAKTYLKKAGLITQPRRGSIKITKRGLEVIDIKLHKIDIRFLKQFPEFSDFMDRTLDSEQVSAEASFQTPEENLENVYQRIRKDLAQELLSKVIELSPSFFERLVVELLVKMGYGGSMKDAGQAIGRSGDEGIEGIIKEDKLGLDVIYVQAKRWQLGCSVGRPEIQKFVGALAGQRAKKGVFITTSTFTSDAINYVSSIDTKIVVIDGEKLTNLMIDYDIGTTKVAIYDIKRIDNDYFSED
ncbi:MAG: restriction endonuclease [Nitrospirae bacterium]|nr:restriction endonuclease [Nitrospirota bacterium]